jgi:membrane peptidoglycan carboxypeptidase
MGEQDMWTGLGSSVNTYFVPLQEKIGTTHVVDVARRLGVRFHTDEDRALAAAAGTWGAFTLGVSAHTPLEMANAFATLAADGVYCTPMPVLEVHDRHGRPVGGVGPTCRRVLDPEVARGAVDAARCPVGDRSAYDRCAGATAGDTRRIVGYPVFGKTGTTDDEKSASLVVSTRQLTMAGFYADPDWPRTGERFEHRGGVNPVVQGALRDAMAGEPSVRFPQPGRRVAFGR